MLNQPIKEGPPNRTAMIVDALVEIDNQYGGIRDVLAEVVAVLTDMNKRLTRVEKELKRRK